MIDLLKYSYNKDYAIFDMQQSQQTYQLTLFHFFSYIVLIENLTPEETKMFSQFLINSLQFIDFQELPTLMADFNKDFENYINPLMKLLFYMFDDLGDKEDLLQVKTTWIELTEIYKRR